MLDSNGCGNMSAISLANGHSKKTVGFGDDQIEWYSQSMAYINREYPDAKISMAFHVQIAAFADAYEKYGYDASTIMDNPINLDKLDSAKAAGDFGVIGRSLKNIWDTDYKVWNTIKKYGVDSVFVGHEHCNSASVTYEGVRLTYGQKSSTFDRYNRLQADGTIFDSSETKNGTPIMGGTFFDLSKTDGSIVDAGLLLYVDDSSSGGSTNSGITIDNIPAGATVTEFDFNGSDFNTTVTTTTIQGKSASAVTDLSTLPQGYTGGVYSYTSSDFGCVGIKFPKTVNADKLLAVFVKMYVSDYTVSSGKAPLLRIYNDSANSILAEKSFYDMGGEQGKWVYVNILDLIKSASGIIDGNELMPFTLLYRFYGSNSGTVYFDSITVVSNGDIYSFDGDDNDDDNVIRGEKYTLYTASDFTGVTGKLNGGSSKFMTISDKSCSVKFSLTPTTFDGTLGIYGFTNKNNPASGIGVKLTKTGATITSGRGTGTTTIETGKTYEVEVGFVSLFNGNTVYTFIKIDGKLIAWELVESYGKTAGNIAIVSTGTGDSFTIS